MPPSPRDFLRMQRGVTWQRSCKTLGEKGLRSRGKNWAQKRGQEPIVRSTLRAIWLMVPDSFSGAKSRAAREFTTEVALDNHPEVRNPERGTRFANVNEV